MEHLQGFVSKEKVYSIFLIYRGGRLGRMFACRVTLHIRWFSSVSLSITFFVVRFFLTYLQGRSKIFLCLYVLIKLLMINWLIYFSINNIILYFVEKIKKRHRNTKALLCHRGILYIILYILLKQKNVRVNSEMVSYYAESCVNTKHVVINKTKRT